MRLRYIVLTLSLLISGQLFGQAPFHRTFEINEAGDTLLHHLASATLADGSLVSVLGRQIDDQYKTLVFLRQDLKGKFRGLPIEYDFGQDTVRNIYGVDIIRNTVNDSLYITANIELNDEPQVFIGKTNANFVDLDIKRINGLDFSVDPIFGDLTGSPNLVSFIDTSNICSTSDENVFLSRLDHDNEVIWSSRYIISDTLQNIFGSRGDAVAVSSDSLIYSHGILSDSRLYQMAVDSLGEVVMSRSYNLEIGQNQASPQDITAIEGGNSAFTGYFNIGADNATSYVVMTDTAGLRLWSRRIRIENSRTELYHINEATSGDIVVGGRYFPDPDTTKLFTIAFDLAGNVKFATSYGPRPVSPDMGLTDMENYPEGGVALAANAFSENGMPAITYIKQSPVGTTACSDTLNEMNFPDITMFTDTLVITREMGVTIGDTIPSERENYSGIVEPILRVDPATIPPYCPNDTIMELLTASVSNLDTSKVSYVWTNEDMQTISVFDTVRVFAEGMYFVSATITENSCYELCDTIELSRSMLPEVVISSDDSQFCIDGTIALAANVSAGRPDFTYVWSTGESDQGIIVTEGGEYSVQIFDQCGDSATAVLDVVPPSQSVGVSINVNCVDANSTIQRLTANPSPALGGYTFEWDTGAFSPTIERQEGKDSYTVTVTNDCGNTAIATYQFQQVPSVEPEVTCDVDNGLFDVSFSASGGNLENIELVDSSGQFETRNLNGGDFTALDRGIIGNWFYFINDECVANCLEVTCCYDFPAAFFPGGSLTAGSSDSIDVIFRILDLCESDEDEKYSQISNYTLKVFNRWGNEVFSTEDPAEAWDGRFNDELVPSEVYIYVAKYNEVSCQAGNSEGIEVVKKGDLTVLRSPSN